MDTTVSTSTTLAAGTLSVGRGGEGHETPVGGAVDANCDGQDGAGGGERHAGSPRVIDLRHEDGPQGSRQAPACRQEPHPQALQSDTGLDIKPRPQALQIDRGLDIYPIHRSCKVTEGLTLNPVSYTHLTLPTKVNV